MPTIITNERWMAIKDYPDYEISDQGRVKSLKYKKSRILKPKTSSGYFMVVLRKDNRSKDVLIHRLIALAFIPPVEGKPQINHKNGIKKDNRIENLEWSTQKENVTHGYVTGLNPNCGEKHYRAKLTSSQVKRIKLISEISPNLAHKNIANMFGVGKNAIQAILIGRVWKSVASNN